MQLIQNGTQAPGSLPAKQPAVGTPGYAYGGPPGSTPSTIWDPDVANTLLAELINVIAAASLSPDPTDNFQVLKALFRVPFKNIWKLTSAGTATFTVPANVTAIEVEVWGAGAGSSAGVGGYASAGGGGGGYAKRLITGLTPGATITATVGAGGTGGTLAALPTAGGTSSFGAYVSATGGVINVSTTLFDGSARSGGGQGVGGDLTCGGGWSEAPYLMVNTSGQTGGNGGAGALGGAGGGGNVASGSAGSWPGGGGGGSGVNYDGLPGADGAIIVRW